LPYRFDIKKKKKKKLLNFFIFFYIKSILFLNFFKYVCRRTQLSVQSLLSGFMPNRTEAIPIHTLPKEIEIFHPNSMACPILIDIENKIKNEDRWKEYIKKNQELKKKLDGYLGYPLNDDNYGFQR